MAPSQSTANNNHAGLRNRQNSDVQLSLHEHASRSSLAVDGNRSSLTGGRPAPYDASSSMPNDDLDSLDSDERDWEPATVENGNARGKTFLLQQIPPPVRSSSLNLPSGASTPNMETTRLGHPVASFPPPPPTWMNMPNKAQLAILCGSRFVDFFQMAALQTFMVHQLMSFDHTLEEDVIAHQAGVLQGAFTASQIVSSILWGRIADQPAVGRKLVLQIGLIGTAFGCVGVAFSKSYGEAVFWRLLSGAINGTVGSARTMVAERTPKPWHPRAFLLLPAAFNIANVFGPILAGNLSNPFDRYPYLFGEGGTFGGATGVTWMKTYPFALANMISTVLLLVEAVIVHLFLEETLKGKRPMELSSFDPIRLYKIITGQIAGARNRGTRVLREQRQGLLTRDPRAASFELDAMNARGEKVEERPPQVLPFRRIWTSNVLWVLVSVAIFDFHMGAFNNLLMLFLATRRQFFAPGAVPVNAGVPIPDIPVQDIPVAAAVASGIPAALPPALLSRAISTAATAAAPLQPRALFKFAAGLAFPPETIGFAMAIIGFIGVALQFILYPWAYARFGLMRSFQISLFLFPAAYFLAPYIALLPSTSPAPDPASGSAIWLGISFVLLLQVAARTFALPATIILINNSSPHPSVLGTIHGVGQATSATFRTLGPMLAGYWYGVWTKRGYVGMAWWIVASLAAIGCVASFWVRNGSGHEIFLPGEEAEMKDSETAGGSGDGR